LFYKACRDIEAGEELLTTYHEYSLFQDTKRWCSKHGLIDPQTFIENLSVEKQRQPWDMHSEAGFAVPVCVKPSSIPDAGLGRFTLKPVAKGAVVRADKIKSVADFIADGGVHEEETVAISLPDASAIDDLVAHFSKGNPDSVAHVRKMMSWYMGGVGIERTDGKALNYVLAHSFITNHGNNHNMRTYVENGVLFYKACRDIEAGEELLTTYHEYSLFQETKTWCTKHGLIDAQTLIENLSE